MKIKDLACILLWVVVTTAPASAAAQLAADWMVPAAAHNAGLRGTFWRTDLSLHNPHDFDLPIVVQALVTDTVNDEVPTMTLTLAGWETINMWDVLGPDGFGLEDTAALLVYADPSLACDPIEDCHLLVTSRTYTPADQAGEFGLAVPGAGVERGGDWSTLSYAAGILNDGEFFRCNVGVASWTAGWTTVALDIQDSEGFIVGSEEFEVPPFGHVQRELETAVTGGSLVFFLEEGPDEALIFPYATAIDQSTGDASYHFAEASVIGTASKSRSGVSPRPKHPERERPVEYRPPGFPIENIAR